MGIPISGTTRTGKRIGDFLRGFAIQTAVLGVSRAPVSGSDYGNVGKIAISSMISMVVADGVAARAGSLGSYKPQVARAFSAPAGSP
jgi:hypothetical protein